MENLFTTFQISSLNPINKFITLHHMQSHVRCTHHVACISISSILYHLLICLLNNYMYHMLLHVPILVNKLPLPLSNKTAPRIKFIEIVIDTLQIEHKSLISIPAIFHHFDHINDNFLKLQSCFPKLKAAFRSLSIEFPANTSNINPSHESF